MSDDILHFASWILGSIGMIFIFLFGVWWKVEHKQDEKIDHLSMQNGKEHKELHDKIDGQHHAIRDRLDNIWRHISKEHETRS